MTRTFMMLFCWVSLTVCSQTGLTKDSFFVSSWSLPANYKSIVGDEKGWRLAGRFNCYHDKLEKGLAWDTLRVYTPFRKGTMFTRIRGRKIIGRGDRRVVSKIIYVDELTLIVEEKWREKIKGKNKKVRMRSRFRRIT